MVKINFEKLKIEVQSIEQSSTDKITKMKTILTEMETSIDEETTSFNELSSGHAKIGADILEMKGKSNNLSTEETTLTTSVTTLKSDLENLSSQLQILQSKKEDLEREVREKTNTAQNLRSEIQKIENSISTEEATITHANISTQAEQDSMEVDMNLAKLEKAKAETYTQILKILLEDKYVSLSYFDVCKVLTQQGVDTVDRLVMASGVDRNTVDETLRELSERGVIGYMPGSQEISIIKQFEL